MNKLGTAEFQLPRRLELIRCQNKSNADGNDLQIVSPVYLLLSTN